MDHIDRAIWSKALQPVVLLVAQASPAVVMAQAFPTGGLIAVCREGMCHSGYPPAVKQGADRLLANWQSFNFGAGHSMPCSSSRHRPPRPVLGSDVSSIQGV